MDFLSHYVHKIDEKGILFKLGMLVISHASFKALICLNETNLQFHVKFRLMGWPLFQCEWKLSCEEWNLLEGKGVCAEIALTNRFSSRLPESCKEMPISEEVLKHSIDEANNELGARKPFIITNLDVWAISFSSS